MKKLSIVLLALMGVAHANALTLPSEKGVYRGFCKEPGSNTSTVDPMTEQADFTVEPQRNSTWRIHGSRGVWQAYDVTVARNGRNWIVRSGEVKATKQGFLSRVPAPENNEVVERFVLTKSEGRSLGLGLESKLQDGTKVLRICVLNKR